MHLFFFLFLSLLLPGLASSEKPKDDAGPNVILVMTDDQGIGDLSCHGNPWLKTPHLDAFYRDAVRMTDFHVSPLCTPTRSAIMTGRYPINNGAWATYKGRDALSENARTMADVFRQNGYRTGIFGKWHLGDNYPVRPTDCGFDVAVHHLAGGVGELSDHWGNSYFDDVYYVNNEPRQFKGYCTDVWFTEAMKFIENTSDQPFFLYLPTNAPHDPFIVADKYAEPYRELVGKNIFSAEFYGMLANFDENFGKLTTFLEEKGLAANTVLIFMTDNGSSGGVSPDGKLGHNHGFRGRKGKHTEGGHRVPFFIRWPEGKLNGGKDFSDLAAHVDLIPTLAGLCDLELPEEMALDGLDFSPLLRQEVAQLPDRTVFVHHRQDWRPPKDKDWTCILTQDWRLVNGTELYDIASDRRQSKDVSATNPGIMKQLLQDNEAFLQASRMNPEYYEFPVNIVGNEKQQEIKLTIQHAIGEDRGIWKAQQVADGMKNVNNTHAVQIERAGEYLISCRRWPKECPGPVLGIPDRNPKDMYRYRTISPEKVRIRIANQMLEKSIAPEEEAVAFKVRLEEGKTLLVADFIEGEEVYGVYYTYVEFLGGN